MTQAHLSRASFYIEDADLVLERDGAVQCMWIEQGVFLWVVYDYEECETDISLHVRSDKAEELREILDCLDLNYRVTHISAEALQVWPELHTEVKHAES